MSKKKLDFKKNKWLALKDILERLGEQPLVAFIFAFCVLPNALPLFNAVIRNDLQEISTRIFTVSAVIVGAIIPLLILKIHEINKAARTKAINLVNIRKFELHRDIELNKQKRYNELLDAKIDSIKTETALISDSMEKQTSNMMIETIQRLADSFRGDISSENYLRAKEYKNSIQEIVNNIKQQSPKYDGILDKISKLDFSNIEPEEEPKEEVLKSTPQQPPKKGICSHCGHHNPPKQIRCKKCKKSCQS